MAIGQEYCQRFRADDVLPKAVEVDIVVAAALHLGKGQARLFGAQMADVDQLGGYERVTRAQRIGQRDGGIQ